MNRRLSITMFSIFFFASIDHTLAQKLLSTSHYWSAFEVGNGKDHLCYIASEPTKKTGKYKKRGDTFILVTLRPKERTKDVFELRAGYTFKKNSEVIIKIDKKRFNLFTRGNTAWADSQKKDSAIVRAMIKGARMTVSGTSNRGTNTVDVYSLKGVGKAYKIISKACKIQ